MDDPAKRSFLHLGGVAVITSLAGCSSVLQGDDDIKDTDDDGVIDSQDYAPRDPEVQAKSDLQNTDCECPNSETETETPASDTEIPSPQGIIADFEDGNVDRWRIKQGRNSNTFDVTTDSLQGEYAARVRFQGHAWLRFGPTSASAFNIRWNSETVSDNEFTISFHESNEDGWPTRETGGFGIEVGAANQGVIAAVPPFENTTSFDSVYDQPQTNTWYETRFVNVDFDRNTCDVVLYDESGTQLGEVTNHRFKNDISAINTLRVKNSMNFSEANAYIDHVCYGELD